MVIRYAWRMPCNRWRERLETASKNEERLSSFAQQLTQVHTITDRFSMANTYLINDEHVVIIDPGSELNSPSALDYLQRFLHRSPGAIALLVITPLTPTLTARVSSL